MYLSSKLLRRVKQVSNDYLICLPQCECLVTETRQTHKCESLCRALIKAVHYLQIAMATTPACNSESSEYDDMIQNSSIPKHAGCSKLKFVLLSEAGQCPSENKLKM